MHLYLESITWAKGSKFGVQSLNTSC
jgi:hypothetical protein